MISTALRFTDSKLCKYFKSAVLPLNPGLEALFNGENTVEHKAHVHCHIVFNSTTLDCTGKFRNPMRSNKIIRRLSDQICVENGLSIIENPKPSHGHYGTWLGDKKEPTWHEKLEQLMDDILTKQPADFETFIKLMESSKCEVKRGKHMGASTSSDNPEQIIVNGLSLPNSGVKSVIFVYPMYSSAEHLYR